MDGWYPSAHRLPITTQEYWDPRPRTLISICDHITDGTDSRDLLQNSDNGSSVNFLVRSENGVGVVYQFMPVGWAAYGNGIWSENNPYMPAWIRALLPACRAYHDNINYYTVSIEHERKYPFYTTLPNDMLAATIDLHRWLGSNYPTIIKDRDHIIGHYQVDNVRRANCPGGPGGTLFPFDRIITAMNTNPGPNPTVPLWLVGAAYPIISPSFAHFYTSEPHALQYFGLPIEAEKMQKLSDGNVYKVQYFERARFEEHGTSVQLGLVGAELRHLQP